MKPGRNESGKAPNVQCELHKLAKVGADADTVLTGLAYAVPTGEDELADTFEKKQQRYSALAKRLAKLSLEVSKTLSIPTNSSDLYEAFLISHRFEDAPSAEEPKRLSERANAQIQPILELLKREAKAFGLLRKNYPRFSKDHFLRGVIEYVKNATGNFHDEEMANLLQAAHAEMGIEESFSAPSLRKLRQRKYPSMIRKPPKKQSAGLFPFLSRPLGDLDKSEGEN